MRIISVYCIFLSYRMCPIYSHRPRKKKVENVFLKIGALEVLGSGAFCAKWFLEYRFFDGNENILNRNEKEGIIIKSSFNYSDMIGGITRFLGVGGALALGAAYGVRLGTIWVPKPLQLENEEYEDIREKEGDFFDWLAKMYGL